MALSDGLKRAGIIQLKWRENNLIEKLWEANDIQSGKLNGLIYHSS